MRTLPFLAFLFLSITTSVADTTYLNKSALISENLITKSELNRWKDDLLFPHLYEQWLTKNISEINQKDVDRFVNNPENKAAAWFFKPKWRSELIRRKDWNQINKSFSSFSDPTLACHYLESLKELKKPLDTDKIKSLWLSGNSRPDHCDPFFIVWLESLKDPDTIVWERQILAFYNRNGTLIRYLNRFYKNEVNRQLGEFLTGVYFDPKSIISQSYDPNIKQMHEIALASVNRMAFQDPRSASNLWLQIVKATPNISQEEIRKASRYLGIAMAKQALPEASYWLTIADPNKEDETVQHWRLQIALMQKDYAYVLDLYDSLSNTLKQSNQWLYWKGVAHLKVNGYLSNDNPLYSLSKRRLYYGYLAAGVLGTAPSLNATPNYKGINSSTLAKRKELIRAKTLYEIGEITRAQVEWNLYVRYQDNDTQHAAALLAQQWGWFAKASQSAGWSGRYDLIELRYPDAYNSTIDPLSKTLELPTYWLYGIMRQESRYERTAVSPAGALGLMQVMPATAKSTAKKHNIEYASVQDLHDPDTNISIGSHYLNDLLARFNHPVFATAAYNAGPSRVKVWRERFPNEITIWIESIPFDETRNYVKSVLAYSQIYAIKSDTNWRLSSWTNPQSAFADLKSQK
jgi:soluble lytic murein transglycosylase